MLKLSIITINYNNSIGLKRTIESVLCQKFNDFEFLVIDGGSTDGSLQLIEKYKNRFSYWISEKDRGIYHAMNKGINKANGDYLMFLNSGDCLNDSDILNDIFKFEYTEDILYGKMKVYKNGEYVGLATTPENITLRTLFEGTIHHQAAFIKRKLFEKYGVYNENYKIRSDWEFWIRTIIINNCSSLLLDKIISNYDGDGYSTNKDNIENEISETAKILLSFFPDKVIADYEKNRNENIENKHLYWVKERKIINNSILFLYNLAGKINKINKKSSKYGTGNK